MNKFLMTKRCFLILPIVWFSPHVSALTKQYLPDDLVVAIMGSGINHFSIDFVYQISDDCVRVEIIQIETTPNDVSLLLPNHFSAKLLSEIVGPIETIHLTIDSNLLQSGSSGKFQLEAETKQIKAKDFSHDNIRCVTEDQGVVKAYRFMFDGDELINQEKDRLTDVDLTQIRYLSVEFDFPDEKFDGTKMSYYSD